MPDSLERSAIAAAEAKLEHSRFVAPAAVSTRMDWPSPNTPLTGDTAASPSWNGSPSQACQRAGCTER
jgi:hypothetical protein